MPASDTLPRSVRVGYGSGSVATGAFGTVPGLMLLPYLTDSLGIAALLAGFIVFLPKAWDVILNPIAGRISDRTVDPRGPRRPWLLRAGLLLAAGFAMLFAAPEMATWLEAAWVLVFFLAGATAPAIRDAVGGRDGYRVMGLVMAVIILVGVLSAYRGTRSAPVTAPQP